jgi:hypothetical protein
LQATSFELKKEQNIGSQKKMLVIIAKNFKNETLIAPTEHLIVLRDFVLIILN